MLYLIHVFTKLSRLSAHTTCEEGARSFTTVLDDAIKMPLSLYTLSLSLSLLRAPLLLSLHGRRDGGNYLQPRPRTFALLASIKS